MSISQVNFVALQENCKETEDGLPHSQLAQLHHFLHPNRKNDSFLDQNGFAFDQDRQQLKNAGLVILTPIGPEISLQQNSPSAAA